MPVKRLRAGSQIAVAKPVLLDTGYLVALVNARDPDHLRCKEHWATLRAKLVTVEGVLVEATHLLRKAPGGARSAVELVLAARAEIHVSSEKALKDAVKRMERYEDVPMDLVDALLVGTGEQLGITEILTLDRRGFTAFRIRKNRAFTILPPPA
jgi:predicted nucleic acid-binding protein